jgi:hypothetical protein
MIKPTMKEMDRKCRMHNMNEYIVFDEKYWGYKRENKIVTDLKIKRS